MEKRLFIVSGERRLKAVNNSSQKFVTFFTESLQAARNLEGENFSTIFNVGVADCRIDEWIKKVEHNKTAGYTVLPVFLNEEDYLNSDTLNHSEPNQELRLKQIKMNRRFASLLLPRLRPSDTILIHDYVLSLLPVLLRKELPGLSIGIYIESAPKHISTPDRQLTEGLLGADLIADNNGMIEQLIVESKPEIQKMEDQPDMVRLYDRLIKIKKLTPADTIANFIQELLSIKQEQNDFQLTYLDDYSRIAIIDKYRQYRKKSLLIDYDSLLACQTRSDVNEVLRVLYSTPYNHVILVSNEKKEWVEATIGQLPVTLVAEHGIQVRSQNGKWTENKNAFQELLKEITEDDFTFVLAATGWMESAFSAFNHSPNAITIKIGPQASYAQYNLQTPAMGYALLSDLSHLEPGIMATG